MIFIQDDPGLSEAVGDHHAIRIARTNRTGLLEAVKQLLSSPQVEKVSQR